MKQDAEQRLPAYLLERASLRGNEYAWRVGDIPKVIEAARQAGLVNIGGQLQFRLPDGSVCECYWIEVDTYKTVSKSLPWLTRVELTAEAALSDYLGLPLKFDFITEGLLYFGSHLNELKQQGYELENYIYFVWYLIDEQTATASSL